MCKFSRKAVFRVREAARKAFLAVALLAGLERKLVGAPIVLSEVASTSVLIESAAEEEPENLARRVGVGSEDMVVGVESVCGRN
jgi:hypothetical protein